jgi:hypothetical protein
MQRKNDRDRLAFEIGQEHLRIAEVTGVNGATERHYTAKEVADMWSLSRSSIIRIFQAEPGVLKIGAKKPRGRRGNVTLRIPESVLQRVHRRMSVP